MIDFKKYTQFVDAVTSEESKYGGHFQDRLRDLNSKEFKTKELSKMAMKIVDIKGVAYYTLGKYRKELNDEQMKKYLELFEKYFLKSFTSRLTDYSDPKINVLSQNIVNEKYTIVSSILVETSERPEIKIDWRVYTKNPKNPLIRDLIIEGLSLARTQKEEFNSVIQGAEGDINALLTNLENFNSKK